MRRLLVIGLVACNYAPNRVTGDGNVPEGATDSTQDTPLVDGCFTTGVTTVCLQVLPDAPFEPPASVVIATDTDPLCVATTPDTGACVVAGTSVTINPGIAVRGIGTKPLILVATTGMLTVAGRIDVANHRGDATDGAGSQPSTCVAPGASGTQAGGPGGSFIGRGGQGGSATGGGAVSAAGRTFTILEGGCRGGPGGAGGPGGETPGRGGGAVELIAISIAITGTINASGEGANGGATSDGGAGGGGSGGAIVLGSPNLTIASSARIAANGGSGGEGSASSIKGADGSDPDPATPLVPATNNGGAVSSGGDGGDGFAGTTPPMPGAAGGGGNSGGGGGGGGGAGIVKAPIAPVTNTGEVSPAIVN